jgi:hypothetical protein
MQFLPPLADASDFPPLTVKANAQQVEQSTFSRSYPANMSQCLIVDRGRTALSIIGRALTGAQVWVPNYHCPAMLMPFIDAEKELRFYPLSETLQVQEAFIEGNVKAGDTVVLVRYFGFDGNLAAISQICRNKGAYVIEDLAHAAFVDDIYGDAAITSLTKFYPQLSAGELWLTKSSLHVEEMQEIYASLDSALVNKVKNKCRKALRKLGLTSKRPISQYFDSEEMHRRTAQQIIRQIGSKSQAEIVSSRRKNYELIANAVSSTQWAKPLYELDDNTVPYVVPVLLTDADYFFKFRHAGIQSLRWEELAKDVTCINALHMRSHLIQIPCHQDLTEQQLQHIIATIKG